MTALSDAAAAADTTIATLEGELETLFAADAAANGGAAKSQAHVARVLARAITKADRATKGLAEESLETLATNYPA